MSELPNQTCHNCGQPFRAQLYKLAAGEGRFCSRACHYASRTRPVGDRFWSHVEKTDGCWIWKGHIHSKTGYGTFGLGSGSAKRTETAHNVAWILAFGNIPTGLHVCHNCPGGDNRACVRPDHLFLGTPGENNADRDRKGRTARGERNSHAKLTETDVLAIRARWDPGKRNQAAIARDYGVTKVCVQAIVTRHTWKHI